MIRVRIELLRNGTTKEIGRLEIDNVRGDSDTADYHVAAMINRPDGDTAMHHRTILNHPRRALNALGLLMAALVALGYDPMKASDDRDQPDLEG